MARGVEGDRRTGAVHRHLRGGRDPEDAARHQEHDADRSAGGAAGQGESERTVEAVEHRRQ